MFIANDRGAVSNPWLIKAFGQLLWGSDRTKAHQFPTEPEALQAGKNAMPTAEMKQRVVAERV